MKTKNYIILFVICIFTVLFTLYFCRIYKNSLVNVFDSSINDILIDVTGSSYEALYNNINNYNKENRNYIIYVASYKSFDIFDLEKNLKDIVIDKGLKNVLYINVDDLKSFDYLNSLLNDFGDGDFSNIKKSSLPVLLFFRNERIYNVVSILNMDYSSLSSVLEELND